MENIEINNVKYKVIENYKDTLDVDDLKEKITDYYDLFDYIVGDVAYGKVRLKGFNNKSNKNYKPINDYAKVQDYLKNYCATNCGYFIIMKIND